MAWCRSCGREIVWAHMTRGELVPIDPEPLSDGTLMRLASGKMRELSEEQRKQSPAPLYRNHRVSCPNRVKRA